MDDLKPIADIQTEYTRQRIVQLCQEGRVRAEKRSIGGVELWFVSQDDVTAYEQRASAAETMKHGWRYPEAVGDD